MGLTAAAVDSPGSAQLSFADVDDANFTATADMSLRDVTFVVVDLERTGGRASAKNPGDRCDAITEIGAVKVRGGLFLGEFGTLVAPGRPIPPQIVQLTGITT